MKKNLYLLLCLCLFITVSCSEDEIEPNISIKTTENVIMASEGDVRATISFTSSREWRADTSADWLAISPSSGKSGTYDVIVTTKSKNTTGDVRTAVVTLTSGSLTQVITLKQSAADFVEVEEPNYIIPADGGDVEIVFTSNLTENELVVYSNNADWLVEPAQTRALFSYKIALKALPNTAKSSRTVQFSFVKKTDRGETELATASITQLGVQVEQSTNYSADKKYYVLQTASIGEGIPIVIMGDGFIDREIADGTYRKIMEKACKNIFSEEPLHSLQSYFDVYIVNAVSQNNAFGTGYKTAFSCKLEGGGSTGISGNDKVIQNYVNYVPDIDFSNSLAVIVLNTSAHAGTTYFGYKTQSDQMVEFAIAYCPVIKDIDSEDFRQVLVHEAVGHGFTKLEDEYSYRANGTMPATQIEQVKALQTLGWAQNVDFISDPTKVLWKSFLNDPRYATQGLGVFEGACTYIKGAYRPSDDSMMNSNTVGFNAPCRKAIYDKVMKIGVNTEKTYDDFAKFDLQNRPKTRSFASSATIYSKPLAHPRFVNKRLIAR